MPGKKGNIEKIFSCEFLAPRHPGFPRDIAREKSASNWRAEAMDLKRVAGHQKADWWKQVARRRAQPKLQESLPQATQRREQARHAGKENARGAEEEGWRFRAPNIPRERNEGGWTWLLIWFPPICLKRSSTRIFRYCLCLRPSTPFPRLSRTINEDACPPVAAQLFLFVMIPARALGFQFTSAHH